MIQADGANYARLTSRRYDIIAVDPPPPIDSAGAAVLYSQGLYSAALNDLRPDGVMLQWRYFGGQDLDQFRAQLHTFSSVFPHVLLLISPDAKGVYMLGSRDPLSWNAPAVSSILGSASAAADFAGAPDVALVSERPWMIILDGMVWLRDGQVERFAGNALLITR